MRLINADVLPRHGRRGGLVYWKDIENAPTVDAEPEQIEFEWCTDCKEYDQEAHCCHRWTKVIRNTVNDLKTQGYEMVKYGMWIWDDEGYHCSNCFFHAYGNTQECLDGTYRYCPSCGARMEGEDETD